MLRWLLLLAAVVTLGAETGPQDYDTVFCMVTECGYIHITYTSPNKVGTPEAPAGVVIGGWSGLLRKCPLDDGTSWQEWNISFRCVVAGQYLVKVPILAPDGTVLATKTVQIIARERFHETPEVHVPLPGEPAVVHPLPVKPPKDDEGEDGAVNVPQALKNAPPLILPQGK
jgi:hypothetical protein